MNLRNGEISIAEILRYPPAREYLLSIYPMLLRHPMIHKAHKLKLKTALVFIGDAISDNKKQEILATLSKL